MSWLDRQASVRRGRKRLIGLNVRGEIEPEVYQVSGDVFGIIRKMLSANQALWPDSGSPLFEFFEVRFMLGLLGVLSSLVDHGTLRLVDLWISDQ